MIRFEVDPTLVADALREGRKLIIEVSADGRIKKATLGPASPHRRANAQQVAA